MCDEGIGGDRTCGKGLFRQPVFLDFEPLHIAEPNAAYSLSAYFPRPEEIAGLDESFYELEERKGYIFLLLIDLYAADQSEFLLRAVSSAIKASESAGSKILLLIFLKLIQYIVMASFFHSPAGWRKHEAQYESVITCSYLFRFRSVAI